MARRITTLTVRRTEKVADHLVRVVLGDPGFDEFEPSEFTDGYVKLHFDVAGETVLRTYTVSAVDRAAREIAIDFVVHGESGVAGPWASNAQPGQPLSFYGPAGAYAPREDAAWHLLAADETGLPALAAALRAMPENARGVAVVEVAGPGDRLSLTAPAGVEVQWVHRGASADVAPDDVVGANAPLVAAVRAIEWRPGPVQVFVHGEAEAVMHHIRPYVRRERGVPAEWASISGYWRRGRTEEGFRTWKRDLAAAEA